MLNRAEDSVSKRAAAYADGQTALVVAPRRWFREGLKGMLHTLGIVSSIEGSSLEETLRKLETGACPSVGIVSLEGIDEQVIQDLEIIAQCCERLPETKWIVLCASLKPAVLIAALRSGIDGLFHVDIAEDVLQRAIELILLGQALFPSGMSRLLLDAPRSADPVPPSTAVHVAVPVAPIPTAFDRALEHSVSLSPRERQILQCLVSGHPNKIIARELNIAEATVKVHIKGLLRKVKVSNRTQAAIWAMNQRPGSESQGNNVLILCPPTLPQRISSGAPTAPNPFMSTVGYATACD